VRRVCSSVANTASKDHQGVLRVCRWGPMTSGRWVEARGRWDAASGLRWLTPGVAGEVGHNPMRAVLGRERALARLLAAVEDAAVGNARLVLVSGEAGMGKSTLVGVAAARSGLAVGWGTGAEAERTRRFGRGPRRCARCFPRWILPRSRS
jgi:hypothetical protein